MIIRISWGVYEKVDYTMSDNLADEILQMMDSVNISDEGGENKNQSVALQTILCKNIHKLEDNQRHFSQPFYVQGLKWQISQQLTIDQEHSQRVMGLYLHYLGGATPSRPMVNVEMEMRLLNQLDSNAVRKKEICQMFDTTSQSVLDLSRYMFWADVINPQRGYVKDDTIIIQVYLAATPPQQKICVTAEPAKTAIASSLGESRSEDERLQSRLCMRAQYLLDTGIGSDCKFLVTDGKDTKTFQASKVFLVKYSEPFELMFFGDFKKEDCVQIEGVKPAVFHQMLKYMYGCDWSFESKENARDLYTLADRFLMDELMQSCLQYLWPNDVESLWEAFDFAIEKNLVHLKSACLKMIREITTVIFKSEEFLQLSQGGLITILEQKHLNVSSELEVFNAAVKWASAQCQAKGFAINGTNLRLELGEGIQYIRFLAMTLPEMTADPMKLGILTAEEGMAYVQASVNSKDFLPPTGLCPLRKPRQLPSVEQNRQSKNRQSIYPFGAF